MTKTICILAPVHPCRDIRVFQKEARSLAAAGYRVVLLAKPDGDCHDTGIELRPLGYKSRLERFAKQPWYLVSALKVDADVYHLHNPDTLPIGFALKLLGKRVVYDTHENFELLIPARPWIPGLLKYPLAMAVAHLELLAARTFDRVIVTQSEQGQRLGRKAVLIENSPITQGPIIEEAYEKSRHIDKGAYFRAVYPGLLSESRGLFTMVDAMEKLNEKLPARLWLMGHQGSNDILERASKRRGWQYVDYLGIVDQTDAFAHMIAADVGLIVFLPDGDNTLINPNKLFEYQRFATPFIASDFSRWRGYIKDVRAGLWVDPTDAGAVSDALAWVAENPEEAEQLGLAGQEFVLGHYNWETESEKLFMIYERLIGR